MGREYLHRWLGMSLFIGACITAGLILRGGVW